jgi:hypothetical protein
MWMMDEGKSGKSSSDLQYFDILGLLRISKGQRWLGNENYCSHWCIEFESEIVHSAFFFSSSQFHTAFELQNPSNEEWTSRALRVRALHNI